MKEESERKGGDGEEGKGGGESRRGEREREKRRGREGEGGREREGGEGGREGEDNSNFFKHLMNNETEVCYEWTGTHADKNMEVNSTCLCYLSKVSENLLYTLSLSRHRRFFPLLTSPSHRHE